MTIFSTDEFDELRGAFYRCNLKESVQPRSDTGRIIDDPDTYNRVQVLLNTPEMEEAHGFLYDIDFDHLNDGVVSKVNDLYELAVDKGFIEDEEVLPIEQEPEFSDDPLPHDNIDDEEKAPFMNSGLDSAYTCLYTAMKDGQLKTGECFSNAKDTQSAKADAISKLANLGFTSIEIIAVEQGDTAARGEPEVANVGSVENIYSDEEASGDETMITEADEDEGAEDTTEAPAEDDSSSDDDPLLSAAGKDDAEDETETSSDEVEAEETSSSEEEVEENPEGEEEKEKETSSKEETVEENPEKTSEEDSKEEEPSEDSSEEKSEKDENNELYEEYMRIWKQVLKNMEKTSFQELSLKEKVDFYRQLEDRWTNEIDPSEFMTPERTKTVEEITITI